MIHSEELYEQMTTAQNLAIIELKRAANALRQADMHLQELGIKDDTFRFIWRYVEAREKEAKEIKIEGMVW